MGVIRDQLQTLTGAELLASQLSTAGGQAFVSANAKPTQTDLADVVDFWRNVHAVAYGQPIPSSSKTVTGNASSPAVFTPASNETAYLTAMSVTNGSGTDASEVVLSIGGAVVMQAAVPPNTTQPFIGFQGLNPGILVVGGQAITLTQTGATASDVSYALAYSLAVQG